MFRLRARKSSVKCVRMQHACTLMCISRCQLEHVVVSRTGARRFTVWNTALQAALFPPNQTFPLSPGESKQARKQTDGTYLCMIIDRWQRKRQMLSKALNSTGGDLSSLTTEHNDVSKTLKKNVTFEQRFSVMKALV